MPAGTTPFGGIPGLGLSLGPAFPTPQLGPVCSLFHNGPRIPFLHMPPEFNEGPTRIAGLSVRPNAPAGVGPTQLVGSQPPGLFFLPEGQLKQCKTSVSK